jgi:peroxin-11B
MCTQAQQIKFLAPTPQRAQKHLEVSLRFWLAGIILSLINGFAKANRLANRARALAASPRTGEKIGSEAERKAALNAVVKESKAVRYQLVIDSLDVWLPATGLGLASVNDGVAGILGCVL